MFWLSKLWNDPLQNFVQKPVMRKKKSPSVPFVALLLLRKKAKELNLPLSSRLFLLQGLWLDDDSDQRFLRWICDNLDLKSSENQCDWSWSAHCEVSGEDFYFLSALREHNLMLFPGVYKTPHPRSYLLPITQWYLHTNDGFMGKNDSNVSLLYKKVWSDTVQNPPPPKKKTSEAAADDR